MLANRKKLKVIYIAWILFGLILAFSVTGFVLSGNGSIYNFYNVGDVYEINDTLYNLHDQQEYGHQEDSGEVVLDGDMYVYGIRIIKNKNKWNYFCIDLDNITSACLQVVVNYIRMEDGTAVENEGRRCVLKEGTNVVEVPENSSFNVLRISIVGEQGDSFFVRKMQLRETAPIFTWKAAIKIYLITYALYSLAICILLFIWEKVGLKCRIYRCIEVLQGVYAFVAEKLYSLASKVPWLLKRRRPLRTILFALMFVYNAYAHMQGTAKTRFKYHLIVYMVILLLITILTIRPKLKKQNWNNALAWSWLALWGMACISDFLVPKNYRYLGYIMVLVVGFFFFVWNNMENPHELVQDFVRAIHIFFGFIIIFCFLFRPKTEGIRYAGISTNPSVFALYLGSIWAVVLGEVENGLRERKPVIKMLPHIIEGCLVAAFCWESQSAGPILCMLAVAFVWFLRAICYTKKTRTQRKAMLSVLSFFLLLIPAYMAMDWGIGHIPQALGHSVILGEEQPLASEDWGMVAHAAGLKEKFAETRLGQKFASATLSGVLGSRDYYYRQYLRYMNLFGHEKGPQLWGRRRLPHNAFLGIAYRYGVFAVVPYILMLGTVLVRTFRYGNKKVEYAGMPFLICLISILMSMTDNVEQPFVWLPWIALYLMMGIVFADEGQKGNSLIGDKNLIY